MPFAGSPRRKLINIGVGEGRIIPHPIVLGFNSSPTPSDNKSKERSEALLLGSEKKKPSQQHTKLARLRLQAVANFLVGSLGHPNQSKALLVIGGSFPLKCLFLGSRGKILRNANNILHQREDNFTLWVAWTQSTA